MTILVLKTDNVWHEWHDTRTVTQTANVYTALYADGRSVDMPCDPYPVTVSRNGDQVRSFYDQGIWALTEIEALGAKIAVPFVVPEGKQIVGEPTYEEANGVVSQIYQVEDIPPPPTPPTAREKIEAMLSDYNLTFAELKEELGLGI